MKQIRLGMLAAALMVAATSIPSASSAGGGDFGVGNGGDGLDFTLPPSSVRRSSEYSAPVPLPTGPKIRYSDLRALWEIGTKTTQDSLTGTWKLVAVATTQGCGPFFKDGYSADGYKNEDGSIMKYTFGDVVVRGNPFGGTKDESHFAVSVTDFYVKKLNQGPYKVDSEEPQFSLWPPYDPAGELDIFYYEYNCRALLDNPNRMVCAVGLKLGKPNGYNEHDVYKRCGQDSLGFMFGLAKETNK